MCVDLFLVSGSALLGSFFIWTYLMVLIIVFYRVSWNLILQFLQLLIFKQGLLDPK